MYDGNRVRILSDSVRPTIIFGNIPRAWTTKPQPLLPHGRLTDNPSRLELGIIYTLKKNQRLPDRLKHGSGVARCSDEASHLADKRNPGSTFAEYLPRNPVQHTQSMPNSPSVITIGAEGLKYCGWILNVWQSMTCSAPRSSAMVRVR